MPSHIYATLPLYQQSNTVLIFKRIMYKQMQRKIKSSKITFENQKENTSGSDLESLLVSSVRYDGQPNGESQGPQCRSKPSQIHQSLIKKQYVSNVYIDEGNEGKCQACTKKLQAINQNLTLVNLKLQEFESKLNLCFGKYGKTQTRMGDIELLMERFKHLEEDNSEKMKEITCSYAKQEQEILIKVREHGEQLNKMRKITYKLQENNSSNMALLQAKRIEHKLQKFKDEQQFKIKQILEVVERVGTLQRKIIEDSQKSDQSTLYLSEGPLKKRYFRTYSICQKNQTNQSTNISYSRNYEFPK